METSENQLPSKTADSCCYVSLWYCREELAFSIYNCRAPPRKMLTGPEHRQPQPTDRFIGWESKRNFMMRAGASKLVLRWKISAIWKALNEILKEIALRTLFFSKQDADTFFERPSHEKTDGNIVGGGGGGIINFKIRGFFPFFSSWQGCWLSENHSFAKLPFILLLYCWSLED